MYVPIERILLRAPLLAAREWRRGKAALERHPLGRAAIEVASPELATARAGEKRNRALDRYGRRAAFRATPNGLWAGVCVGVLGRTTKIATGEPRAHFAPSWASVDAAARRLLDDVDVREQTRLRVAPSVLMGAATIAWLGPGEPFGEAREAELDERLAAVLEAARAWAPWGAVREAAADDDEDVDEFLLMLVDDGLLQSDLAPPLVGTAPEHHLAAALGALEPPLPVDRVLEGARRHAVLVHEPVATPVVSRAAVERAARLVPLLVRLQEALAPPAAERLAQPALADALDAVTELYGAGAYDLAGLATGDYGVDLAPRDEADAVSAGAPDLAVVASIFDSIAAAARRGEREVALDPNVLGESSGDGNLPPTAELFLVPTPTRPGERPGTGWLLGLHAPAGASLGRFAHALGAPLNDALAELAATERRLLPDAEILDVAFAPSASLADLAAHPKIRARTLALSRWNGDGDVAPGELELCADPSLPEALGLRARGGALFRPSPLARVRSATAPAGVARLLAGWSLHRQHAPWALPLGPLAALEFIPRLTLDGFVVSPASWRLPAALGPTALARWRRALAVPRIVQVGSTDELLPVDLDARGASADLAGQERVFEIWPPIESVVDRDGRRVEAVVMLVDAPAPESADARAGAAAAARELGSIPPPGREGAEPGWRTFKLFGSGERRSELFRTALVPAVTAARAAGEIDGWFFLPYLDGPGRRPHLRLRVHAPAAAAAFEARLALALAPAAARGALVAVESCPYTPERGRFRPDELDAVHAIFESQSALCAELAQSLELDEGFAGIALAAQAADALARGLGFDREARAAVARDRRRAAEAGAAIDDEGRAAADTAFRSAGRALRAALEAEPAGPFARHEATVSAAARGLPTGSAARLVPTLLHLGAVRLLGPDPDGERLAYTFWQRTLEGLARSKSR